MKSKIYFYPIWVRIWHMLNMLIFIVLIYTGLCLQFTDLNLSLFSFNYTISLHNLFGFASLATYIYFLIGNQFTSNGSYYQIQLSGFFTRLLKQFRYYGYGIFKKEEPPYPVSVARKFNPLQKFSYVMVMYFLVPIVILTGLGLFFPEYLPKRMLGTSGIHFFDLVHITTGFIISLFMVVHIYFCTIGKTATSNFKSMINGWH